MTVYYVVGDAREVLSALPPASVDLGFSSPPFFKQRQYLPEGHPDAESEIGRDETPGGFVDTLLDVTERLDRVLANHGSGAFELGDGYCNETGDDGVLQGIQPLTKGLYMVPEMYRIALTYGSNPLTRRLCGRYDSDCPDARLIAETLRVSDPEVAANPAALDMVEVDGIETMVKWIDLRWRVRNVIDICRSNPNPGALTDQYRAATSDLVIFARDHDRWFDLDAVRVPHKSDPAKMAGSGGRPGEPRKGEQSATPGNPLGAPPSDWWSMSSRPYPDAHIAVMNPQVAGVPIQSMCPRKVCRVCGEPQRREATEVTASGAAAGGGGLGLFEDDGPLDATAQTIRWSDCGCVAPPGQPRWRSGIVLDPFGGVGTTGMVASGLGRDCVLIDLNESNVELARGRVGPLFFEEVSVDQLVEVLAAGRVLA